MRYTITIPQLGVVRAGLLQQLNLDHLAVLDVLRDMSCMRNAERIIVEQREFTWAHYLHVILQLPLVFNGGASSRTLKNQLVRLMAGLRDVGLVETVRLQGRQFFRLTDRAASLHSERAVPNSRDAVTAKHDTSVTKGHDVLITERRDDSTSLIMDDPGTKDQSTKEPESPHSPPEGEHVNDNGHSLTQSVEKIYAAYPRKVGKPAAFRAIRRALVLYPPDFLMERTRHYAETYNGPAEYIPHPSTWFRQQRFNDDPATWRRTQHISGKPQSKTAPARQFDPANYSQPLNDV